MIKGRKVYDPLTDTWSTGYWVADVGMCKKCISEWFQLEVE